MSNAVLREPTLTQLPIGPQYLQIDDADWQTYERFLLAIGGRKLRCTYDRGRLQIMAPLRLHEREKKFLGRVVETVTLDLNWPLGSCGSMTIRREDLERGFEPDECYYIEHEAQMRTLREPDFRVDPPPDLAIEVDVTNTSLDRITLYAALGILEVWRLDQGELQFLHLQSERMYAALPNSRAFPFLPVSYVNSLLDQLSSRSETDILRELRSWLQLHGPKPGSTTP